MPLGDQIIIQRDQTWRNFADVAIFILRPWQFFKEKGMAKVLDSFLKWPKFLNFYVVKSFSKDENGLFGQIFGKF